MPFITEMDFIFYISGLSSHGDQRISDNREEPRHCGKSTPRDFSGAAYSVSSNAALRIVFHTNRDDSCKGFAFQYRVETSKWNLNFGAIFSIKVDNTVFLIFLQLCTCLLKLSSSFPQGPICSLGINASSIIWIWIE